MRSRFFILLSFIFVSSLGAREIAVEAGISRFKYLEVSENLKEDLYKINSALVGFRYKEKGSVGDVVGSINLQMPYEVFIEDLYGEDSRNYLEGTTYYGLNIQLGTLYPIIEKKINLSAGLLFNYDYFYFKDNYNNVGKEFRFSVLGYAVEIDIDYPINEKFKVGLTNAFIVNCAMLHRRGEEFKWSYNMSLGTYVSYSFI